MSRANGYEYWIFAYPFEERGVRATCPKCNYKSLSHFSSHFKENSARIFCASDQCDWSGDFTEGLVYKDSPNLTHRNTQDPHSGIKAPAWLLGLKEEKI